MTSHPKGEGPLHLASTGKDPVKGQDIFSQNRCYRFYLVV